MHHQLMILYKHVVSVTICSQMCSQGFPAHLSIVRIVKMSGEEIKKFTEAISKNSDNLFVCPRPVGPWQAPKGGLGHNSPPTLHGTTVHPLKVTGVLCSRKESL